MLEADKRPVSAVADNFEVRRVTRVDVRERRDISLTMLFDAGRTFEERVLAEQFCQSKRTSRVFKPPSRRLCRQEFRSQ